MNWQRIIYVLVGSFLFISSSYCSTEKYWHAVDSALHNGLPKIAIQNLDTILIITQKEKKYDEWLRALSQKVVMEATIQGNKPEEKVRRLQAEFANADATTRPLLQAILAQWYWQYFNRNRWRFTNRTATDKMSEEDFTTWDLFKIIKTIDSLYTNILNEKNRLTKIKIDNFLGFLEKGTLPTQLTPTLYDFIAREALTFYTSAEQAAVKSEDAFEIDASSDAFSDAEQFLKFRPVTENTSSAKYKALKLYQSLMAYHHGEKNVEPFLDIDIQRLNYLKNVAYGEERDQIFIQRMTYIVEKNTSYSISSLGSYYLAKALAQEGDAARAYEVAKKGFESHTESVGGEACRNYMIELSAKSLKLTGEKCVPPGLSKIQVSYKNFTKIFFKIYTDAWDDFLSKKNAYPNEIDSEKIKQLLANAPIEEWESDLPATQDFKEKTISIDVPKLKPGYYRIFASWQADFKNSTMLQHTWLWVCDYTLVSRTGHGFVDGLVVDAVNGEPIEGAVVTKIIQRSSHLYDIDKNTKTDEDGYFKFKANDYEHYLLHIKNGAEELLESHSLYTYGNNLSKLEDRIVFFTDRSIYRPGQTIYFKGICTHVDQEQGNYEVIPDCEVVVHFRDANYQEITKQTFRTNDFGSFNGQFTAPTDRLNGNMSLWSENPHGSADIRVEEYKRPKFTVKIETPKQAVKLNQEIEVNGNAVAYTGAPIDNADVRFSVVRNVSYPCWWQWYHSSSYYQNHSQQIAHGRIKTDAGGNFKITFFAKPDPRISAESDPTFSYSIHADVISPDGETRSGDGVIRIGYKALEADVATDQNIFNNKKFPLIFATQTLDGNRLSAKGKIEIYKLKEPIKPIRAKLGYNYWNNNVIEDTTEEFGENWMLWPKDDLVYTANVSTEISNPDTVYAALPSGLYKIECVTKDKYDKEVKAYLPLMILPDWDSKNFNIKLPSVVRIKSNPIEVGEELEALWGTGYDSGRCFIEIEHDGIILKRFWTEQNGTQHSFDFPVNKKLRGGFVVHFTHVHENRAYLKTISVDVPWDNKELDVTTETFRDKLVPGEKETMTLKIKGKKNAIDTAEMVATMYDFSLDQFYPYHWNYFDFFKRTYTQRQTTFINSAQSYNAWRSSWNEHFNYPTINYTHFPNYVIENFFHYQFPTPPIIKVFESKGDVIYGRNREFEGEYCKIKGKVIDAENGEALVGVNIIIVGTTLGAVTNLGGEFTILFVPAGTCVVKASLLGYHSLNLPNVKTEKGKFTTINFRLVPQAIETNALVICAERMQIKKDVATSVACVSSEEITTLPIRSEYSANKVIDRVETIDLKNVVIRKNLNETAFFYPHLLTDKDGMVKIEFTMPEALTKWKFMAFAHGKECESGVVTRYAVTQKELMVQPNAPRFLREGDSISFTAKVVNMSDHNQEGGVQLDFKNFITEQPVNNILGLESNVQEFELKAHSSEAFAWKIFVPKGTGPLSYTVVAKSDSLSDGETGVVPVLSSRIFLTESVPLNIRGPKTKNFVFDRLTETGTSKTFEPFKFTVQMASNPTWYAIQALPYLMEFPYECTEQVFNRFYANSLAGHIANSNPRIKEISDEWRKTGALKSNLEKNQELKSLMLMETPWVVEAQNETQAKQNLASLFEENTLNNNLNSALNKLKTRQLSDGSWPWFPGGYSNDYMTLYIVTGFGRLKHLGVKTDSSTALKAIDYLDKWVKSIYDRCDTSLNNLSPTIAMYLYCRSFYIEGYPIPQYAKEAVDYFIKQSEEHWLTLDSRLSQGYLSLALHRFGKGEVARKVLASLKERSVQNEEMGMFWREDELSCWWYRAPIETQALMIEAFAEITNDSIAVEDCKAWLLKQKQTQNWKTTKATADAVYALVLRRTDYLANTKPVEVKLGDETVKPENIEAGTGFYEKTYYKNEIERQFSNISVIKEDKGIAWGGAHLQYFEEISSITPHATNLKLEKKLFLKNDTKKGKIITPITGPLSVGDIVTVKIILRVDRDMEYVHLKDMRGSGLEPVDVLSQYRCQDGLRYYQSTKDAATHFFIDYLSKGTYIFEYDLRVQLKGRYQNGIAEIQCMYAPEFNSHSDSQRLEVQ